MEVRTEGERAIATTLVMNSNLWGDIPKPKVRGQVPRSVIPYETESSMHGGVVYVIIQSEKFPAVNLVLRRSHYFHAVISLYLFALLQIPGTFHHNTLIQ